MLASIYDDPPILVCADLQVEYLTPGRRHVIVDGDATTSRCLELLTLWRDNLWPVMHLKRIAQAAWFNPSSRLTDWIAETKPRPGEMTFEHPLPSAYSSSRFADYMSNIRQCALRADRLFPRRDHPGHRRRGISPQPPLPGVSDAVACRQPGAGEATAYKQSVVNVIANFATLQSSAELIGTSGAVAV